MPRLMYNFLHNSQSKNYYGKKKTNPPKLLRYNFMCTKVLKYRWKYMQSDVASLRHIFNHIITVKRTDPYFPIITELHFPHSNKIT